MLRKYRYSQPMDSLNGRLAREHKTLVCMTHLYCADHHPGNPAADLCPECQALMDYAERRLAKCPYGTRKPTCAKCPIHCYKPAPKAQVRDIMRYAGPRMTWRHPLLSLFHLLDKFRRVEHPMQLRGRLKGSTPKKETRNDPRR
ncbi:MAG: nitrous oxide-stimulated promoter family protein [Gammaproteobacteria bacterium]|nr:nitrous oxide-stimulated promoter family protein [Gammaproteobacteria bacterium]NNJ78239.1 nitrous oxide-stimulated promoter family protein [Xanthomonadales bacterium]